MESQSKPQTETTFGIGFQHIETLKSDGGMLYPYYPIVSALDSDRELVLAVRSRDSICFYYFTDKIERMCLLNCDDLPRATITAIHLVPTASHEIVRKEQRTPPPIYLYVGYVNGYLFLLRCVSKEVKVIQRYNRLVQPESGFLSKTFSFFYSGSANEYSVWQKASVTKVVQHRQSLTYLLRNSIIVALQNVGVPGDMLQQRFELILKNLSNLKRNSMERLQECTYYVNDEWRMVCTAEGAIMAFDKALSSMAVTEDQLVVGTFQGHVYVFNRATLLCLERVITQIAIRSIAVSEHRLLLSLQDDSAQIVDLARGVYLNIVGHKSFVCQAAQLQPDMVLLASFDGTISLTGLPPHTQWTPISKRDRFLHTLKSNSKEWPTTQKFDVGKRDTGIGFMLIHLDFMILSLFDGSIKVYRITKGKYSK